MPKKKVLLRTGKSVSQDVFDKTFPQLEALKIADFDALERLYNYLQLECFDYRPHTRTLLSRGWDFISRDGKLSAAQIEIIFACVAYKKGSAIFVDPLKK